MDGLHFRRTFSRSPETLRDARKIVVDFMRRWLSGEALVDLEIAVGEALANVVEHGGGLTFTVTCDRHSDRVTVEITDRGIGFQPSPEHEERPDVGAPRGYGIFLMRHLLDGVEYLDDGARLRLTKMIPPACSQTASDTNNAC